MKNVIVGVVLLILCVACSDDMVPTVPGLPASHLLITIDPVVDTTCAEAIMLTGTVLGAGGIPAGGENVTFEIVPGSPMPGSLTGTFSPVNTMTDILGLYSVDFTLDPGECASCVGGTVCSLRIRATAAGEQSNDVLITETL